MALSKKDYVAAARIVRERHMQASDDTDVYAARVIEDCFAEFFRKGGGRFDELRFREACNK